VVNCPANVLPDGVVPVIWKLKSWGPSSTLSSMMVMVSHAVSPFIVVVDGNVASYVPAGGTGGGTVKSDPSSEDRIHLNCMSYQYKFE